MDAVSYETYNILYENELEKICRAVNLRNDRPVIIKILKNEDKLIASYKSEYELSGLLDIEGVLKIQGLDNVDGCWTMELSYSDGDLLNNIINTGEINLSAFLDISMGLCKIVEQLHKANVVHNSIKPQCILYDRKTGVVELLGLGNASFNAGRSIESTDFFVQEKDMYYISPEQTGIMNCEISHRTDFYSMGIVFYQLLTGFLPFSSKDPIEVVHSHMARMPSEPYLLKSYIPRAVYSIMMKLLSKNAGDRYNTAAGLRYDLEECKRQWERYGRINDFAIGSNDRVDDIDFPDDVFGREEEIRAIIDSFKRVGSGSTEMVVLEGASGVGGTSLINHVKKRLEEEDANIIIGKFERNKSKVPYYALKQAFGSLIKKLLMENEEKVSEWRERILKALGKNGNIIVEIIPDLELIIGKQPLVVPLRSDLSQNRFNVVFQKFISVFKSKGKPLVILLENMQWADNASVRLLRFILSGNMSKNILIIGNVVEADKSRAFLIKSILEKMIQKGAGITFLNLKPLRLESIKEFLAATFGRNDEAVSQLSEYMLEKTNGIPLLIKQLLKSFYNDNLLSYDARNSVWSWDITRIRVLDDATKSYGLIEKIIERVSPDEKELLQAAACIGREFDSVTIREVLGKNSQQINKSLRDCVLAGLIEPERIPDEIQQSKYKFIHNRILQAVHDTLPEYKRCKLYLKLGRVLLSRANDNDAGEKLYDILFYLNAAREMIRDEEERIKTATLNLKAGLTVKKANAYMSAAYYFENGMSLLSKANWNSHYSLALDLNLGYCECKYHTNDITCADAVCDSIIGLIRDKKDIARLYALRINYYSTSQDYQKAMDYGVECLGRLGINITAPNNRQELKRSINQFVSSLSIEKIQELNHLNILVDEEKAMIMRIMESLIIPALHISKQLMAAILYDMLQISIHYGNSVESSICYTIFGMLIATEYGQQSIGYEFGRLGCSLAESYNSADYRARVYQGFDMFSKLAGGRLVHSLEYLLQAQQFACEIDDTVFVGYNSCNILTSMLVNGSDLNQLLISIENSMEIVRVSNDEEILKAMEGIKEALLMLKYGEAPNTYAFINTKQSSIYSWQHVFMLQSLYIMGRYDDAVALIDKLESYSRGIADEPQAALISFYSLLSIAQSFRDCSGEYTTIQNERITNYLKALKKWAKTLPVSFSAIYSIARAERERLSGKDLKAIEYYELAINQAKEQEHNHYTAIAYELMSRYFMARGHKTAAEGYLREAHSIYGRWGANGKAASILHNSLYTDAANEESLTDGKSGIIKAVPSNKQLLDIEAVIKATQAISSEIVLDNIIERLMKISIECSGAQRCVFLKPEEEGLIVKCEYNTQYSNLKIIDAPLDACRNIPKGLINYVHRTKSDLVLDDAASDSLFTNENYISAQKIKSVLCVPIIYRAKTSGVFYLENNLVSKAFTEERVRFLKIMFSQAAISMENAIIYKKLMSMNVELEKKVEERTKTLKETVEQLQLEIFEREAAQQALKENEERLNTLINAIPDIIYFKNGEGKLIEMNEAAAELICKSDKKADFMDIYNTKQYKGSIEFIENDTDEGAWASAEIQKREEIVLEENGVEKTLDVVKVPLFDDDGNRKGLVVIGRDISQRKLIERHLSESEERYRTLVELSPVSIMVFSRGRVLYTNIEGAKLLGYEERSKVIGARMLDIIKPHDDSRSDFAAKVRGAVAEGYIPLSEQKIIRKSDGRVIDVEATATSFKYNGDNAVLVVSKDISERKIAEELKRKSEENLKLLKEAMEYDKLKTEFFSNISHELKTPLNVILGSLQLFGLLLKDSPDWDNKSKVFKYSMTMKQNCFRLLRLVNNLIDITKIDSGFFKLNLQNHNIVNIVEEITLSVADYIESKNLTLVFDTDLEEKLMACDPDKIERIILNLLSNSIKFSKPGGIISVALSEIEAGISISVRDNGIGIPEDKQQLIFERFRQVDKSFVRNHEGSGIGLALVKSLVELHGGEIGLNSEPEVGSEFIVELPSNQVAGDTAVRENTMYSREDKIEKIQIEFSDIYFYNY